MNGDRSTSNLLTPRFHIQGYERLRSRLRLAFLLLPVGSKILLTLSHDLWIFLLVVTSEEVLIFLLLFLIGSILGVNSDG